SVVDARTRSIISPGAMVGPEGYLRTSSCPCNRSLMCVPPTSITRIVMAPPLHFFGPAIHSMPEEGAGEENKKAGRERNQPAEPPRVALAGAAGWQNQHTPFIDAADCYLRRIGGVGTRGGGCGCGCGRTPPGLGCWGGCCCGTPPGRGPCCGSVPGWFG